MVLSPLGSASFASHTAICVCQSPEELEFNDIIKEYNYLRTCHWHYNKNYCVLRFHERFDHINNFIP